MLISCLCRDRIVCVASLRTFPENGRVRRHFGPGWCTSVSGVHQNQNPGHKNLNGGLAAALVRGIESNSWQGGFTRALHGGIPVTPPPLAHTTRPRPSRMSSTVTERYAALVS